MDQVNTDQIKGMSRIAQGSTAQSSHCASKTMARQDEFIARVGLEGRVDSRGQVVGDGFPGLQKAAVSFAASAQATRVSEAKVQIGNPGSQSSTASEGEHEELVGLVCGQEAGYIAELGGPCYCQDCSVMGTGALTH